MGLSQTLNSQHKTILSKYLQYFDFNMLENSIVDYFPNGKNEDLSSLTEVIIPKYYNGVRIEAIISGAFKNNSFNSVIFLGEIIIDLGSFCGGLNISKLSIYSSSTIHPLAFCDSPIVDIFIVDNVIILPPDDESASTALGIYSEEFEALYTLNGGGHYIYNGQRWIKN